ncbi:MAG: right-handed parallel beta-helix repeat-containing protein, partial [Verrucomicrobiota bacterium]
IVTDNRCDTATTYALGAGIFAMSNSVIENCIITRNRIETNADNRGGGIDARNSTLRNCIIRNNHCTGGPNGSGGGIYSYQNVVEDCYIGENVCKAAGDATGGGIYTYNSQVDRVVVRQNRVEGHEALGGGVYVWLGAVKNGLIFENEGHAVSTAKGGGGYLQNGALLHCTVSGNELYSPQNFNHGIRSSGGSVMNSIIYFNGASEPGASSPNYTGKSGAAIASSCAWPQPSGSGNIGSDPQFVNRASGVLRLEQTSPCIDTASPSYVSALDAFGHVRPSDGDGNGSVLPDMGAIEYLEIGYDVMIRKTGLSEVATNTAMQYSIVVSNSGPQTASGVVVTDALPAEVTFISASAGGAYAGHEVVFTLDPMTAGATTTLTVSVHSPLAPGVITNHALVDGGISDLFNLDVEASWVTEVNLYDLSVVNTGPAWVESNTVFNYSLVVSNAGPGRASGVTLDNLLPDDVQFQSASASHLLASQNVIISLDDLVAGASTTVTISAMSPPEAGTMLNAVQLSAAGDTNEANNSDGWLTEIATYDVSITMSGPSVVETNTAFSYTFEIENAGMGIARSLVVTDPLPPALTLLSVPADCVFVGGQLICSFPELTAGSSTTVQIDVRAPTTPLHVTNQITLSSSPGDTHPSNNFDQVATFCAAFATRYVNVNNPSPSPPYLTWATAANEIQSAVDLSIDFDRVLVSNGTYEVSSTVRITNGIAVSSVNGPETTWIDGNYSTRCVWLDHPDAALEGFTVRRGYPGRYEFLGGGIYLPRGRVSDCIINSNVLSDATFCAALCGGGIFADIGTVVENCVISENAIDEAAEGNGAGLYAVGATIRNCLIRDNVLTNAWTLRGAGAYIRDNSVLLDSVIEGNGLHHPRMRRGDGGGLYTENSTVRDTRVSGNLCYERGGGIYAIDSRLDRVVVNGNRAGVVDRDDG